MMRQKGFEKKIIAQLSELAAFSKFSNRELKQFVQDTSLVELYQGEILFNQGEVSDNAFLLISGKLAAVLDWGKDTHSFLGLVKPGDLVGEMGVILGDTRSCSIIAQNDSCLLSIPKEVFQAKMQKNASLLMLINRLLTIRLKNTIKKINTSDLPRTIALLPANETTNIDEFVLQFKRVLQGSGLNYLIIDSENATKALGANYTEIKLTNWLEEIEADHDFTFLVARYEHQRWFSYVSNKSERVLILRDVSLNQEYSTEINRLLNEKRVGFAVKEIVLLHPPGNTISNTIDFLPEGFKDRFHHIERGCKEDYQRLLRFSTGNATGLVLSGGGTRGWAHVGALIALQEFGICIDAMCGTSTGSLISSVYLMSETKDKFIESVGYLFNIGEKSINWYDYTWPKVSMISGKTLNAKFLKIFNDTKIEDLKIPYMAVASNLSKAEQVILRKDSLWKAIRSSCSIPGILPPMVFGGDLIVDGGILNNFPTDIMFNFLENKGFIIAVDLSLTETQDTFNFPHVLTVRDYFRNRFKENSDKFRLPSVGNIIMQSISIGSSQLMHANKRLADLFIQPKLYGASMLTNPDHQKLIDAGYNEMLQKIREWEEMHGQSFKEFCFSVNKHKKNN